MGFFDLGVFVCIVLAITGAFAALLALDDAEERSQRSAEDRGVADRRAIADAYIASLKRKKKGAA